MKAPEGSSFSPLFRDLAMGLRPDAATRWIIGLRDHPVDLPRARRFGKDFDS